MKKTLRILGITIVVVLVVIAASILNAHLRNTNRLFYATGTTDKAFLNTTWKMSPLEIERANHTTLSQYDDVFLLLGGSEIMDKKNKKRFTEYVQKDVSLWGYPVELHYLFFDRLLYEYYISLTAYEPDRPMKDVVNTLQQQFGTGKPMPEMLGTNFISYFQWQTPKQKLYCWLGTKDEKGNYNVGIRVDYEPLVKRMDDIAKSEKKKYF
jgi:hypothetical protein